MVAMAAAASESDAVTALGRTDAFWGFPAAVRARLVKQSGSCVFAPGEVLYHQGERLAFCYLILRGRVLLQRRFRSAIDPVRAGECLPTEIIPYAPLRQAPCPDTAVAAEETEVLVLNEDAIVEALRSDLLQATTALAFLGGRERVAAQIGPLPRHPAEDIEV
jgi:CRP-like cAMP-binding protein